MNIELKKKKETRNAIIRWFFYIVIMLFSYIFITTVQTGYSIPLLLIPTAVCVSLREHPFYSAIYAAICGLLLDSAQGTLQGFNAIILMWACILISLLAGFYMRKNILSFIVLDLVTIAIQSIIHYMFYYMVWNYDESYLILTKIFIPEFIFTNVSGILIYYITLVINRIFGTVTEHYIEEKTDDVIRE